MIDQRKLEEIIKSKAKNGKISCADALRIAKENEVDPKLVGEILNKLKIKIINCQLGCF